LPNFVLSQLTQFQRVKGRQPRRTYRRHANSTLMNGPHIDDHYAAQRGRFEIDLLSILARPGIVRGRPID
jgi:hypothetical protein